MKGFREGCNLKHGMEAQAPGMMVAKGGSRMLKSALEDFYELPIERVMKKTGFAVLPKDTPVEEVLETLIEFGHIWVTEYTGSRKVVGVIARKDFVEMAVPPQFARKSTPGRTETKTLYYRGVMAAAEDMMTRNVVKIDAEAKVKEALKLMSANFLRQLPVVRQEEIVGEVSTRDLIRNYVELFKYHRKSDEEKKRKG